MDYSNALTSDHDYILSPENTFPSYQLEGSFLRIDSALDINPSNIKFLEIPYQKLNGYI